MKFNIMPFTLFLILMVTFFPSLIHAPWTLIYPPKPPEDGILRNCAQWISYNGFTLDNYQINREKAITRDVMKDRLASMWAAMYAFKIGGLRDIYQILPQDFCNSFGPENLVQNSFKALKDVNKNCVDWVTLYGFSDNDHNYNYTYVRNTDPVKVIYISIWAYAYWIVVWRFGQTLHIHPLELCILMGKNVGELASPMPFMSEYVTKLSCMEWFYLFDYTDYPAHNIFKAVALNNASLNFDIHIQYFPGNYAIQLLQLFLTGQPIDYLTPMEFCKKYDGDGYEPQRYKLNFKEY